MKKDKGNESVDEKRQAAEENRLRQQGTKNRNIHGIACVSIQTRNHQLLGWIHGSQCPASIKGEAPYAIKQDQHEDEPEDR
jgi:hypothetical protein